MNKAIEEHLQQAMDLLDAEIHRLVILRGTLRNELNVPVPAPAGTEEQPKSKTLVANPKWMKIWEALEKAKHPMTHKQLARATKLPVSTVGYYLREHVDAVAVGPNGRGYQLRQL